MGLFDAITSLFGGSNATALPADFQHYVGLWQGPTVRLSVSSNGEVDYKQTIIEGSNTRNRSVTGRISSFSGNSFNVGVLGMNTTFNIQTPPHQNGEGWTMILDGEQLRRVG